MIQCKNLSYWYPNVETPVLKDVSLTIDAGDFVLVTGPSGAGKSTWLRTLNGLVPHFTGGKIDGSVIIDGNNVVALGPNAMSQLVGMVFQSPEAQAVLDTVEPEIAFALENAAIPPHEMRLRVEETLDLLGIAHLRKRSLSTLSGGERQRVAIASAIALRPQILVLDEPTSQLDPLSAENMLQSLVRLNQDLGLTIILAEHRLDRVLPYGDRLLHFEDGVLRINAPIRDAVTQLPTPPPLVQLAKALHWQPTPLTIKEGRRFARQTTVQNQPKANAQKPSTPHVQVTELNVGYANCPVIKNTSFALNKGEIVALLGRNGSGKTTLLKAISGLLPSQGQIVVDGVQLAPLSVVERSRLVAYLPQNPDDLLFADSVREELAITLKNHKLSPSSLQISPDDLLRKLGIGNLDNRYPRDLSVGQRQRVALAALLVTGPQAILLDEPTRGLDPQSKADFADLLSAFRGDGRSILLVTHDVELAALVADRVLILADGELIAGGDSAEILTSTPLFAPQIAKLYPATNWLTVADAVQNLRNLGDGSN